METVDEVKQALGVKTDGMAYLIMTAVLDEEKIVNIFTRAMNEGSAAAGGWPKDHVPGLLSKLDIDLSDMTDGMGDGDKDLFYGLLALWMKSVDDPSSAAVFVLMLRRYLIQLAQKKNILQKAAELLGKGILLAPDEAREMFRIMKNITDDAHYACHPRTGWPLYDKLAFFLGENSLAEHNEALRLRDGEEMVDEWRERCRELEREREERDE